jgi:WD40 repeat protein
MTVIAGSDLLVTDCEEIIVWNWRTGSRVHTISGIPSSIAVCSHDGTLLAVNPRDTHQLDVFWGPMASESDRYRRRATADLTRRPDRPSFSPDGKTLAAACWIGNETGTEHNVWLLSLPNLRQRRQLPPPQVSQLAFAPDGRHLILRDQQGLALWNLSDHKIIWRVPQADAAFLTFSSGGERIYSRFDFRSVIVRSARDGAIISRPVTHLTALTALAVSPDGQTLITGSQDGVIRVTHVPTGRPLFDLSEGGLPVQSLQFSSDGLSLFCLRCPPSPEDESQIVIYETMRHDSKLDE